VFDIPFNCLSTAKLKLLKDTTANICICQHPLLIFLKVSSFFAQSKHHNVSPEFPQLNNANEQFMVSI
tara:strand:- start:602 stop:805 length:204 start_codon:yes stop_codon:yes gene_type:complete